MIAFFDLLRLIRLAQAQMAVAHYNRDIERSKVGLAKALAARDMAMAAVRIHEHPPHDSEPPRFLLISNKAPQRRKTR